MYDILQSLPAAVYATDAMGRITFYNEAAAELWGVRPELGQREFPIPWQLFWPDGSILPSEESAMAIALREQRSIKGQEVLAERSDGTRVALLAHSTPLYDEAGRFSGTVNMLVDISAQKSAALASQRLSAIVESSDDAILSKDINGIITSWNRGAERLFGYGEAEVIGKPVTILIPPDRQNEEPEILGRIRRGERIDHYETVRQKKDGSLVHISLSVSPIADSSGRVVGASKIARDISDRRSAEEQKELLLGEMSHRVKNLFALAGGLVNLSARGATSIPDLVSELQGKFLALSRAHSLTVTVSQADATPIPTLHALIAAVAEPYDQLTDHRIIVAGPDVPLGPKAVTNLALLLHEFCTNALKYGALGTTSGQVLIECFDQGANLSIVWKEPDAHLGAGKSVHEGFGSRLARATVSSLGGDLSRDFTPHGLEIRLTVPRAKLAE